MSTNLKSFIKDNVLLYAVLATIAFICLVYALIYGAIVATA